MDCKQQWRQGGALRHSFNGPEVVAYSEKGVKAKEIARDFDVHKLEHHMGEITSLSAS